MNTPVVSVVVPTYNRPDLLERCLGALLAQDFDPAGFEIVVVDDAASESTRKQVEDWSRKVEVYVLWPKGRKRAPVQTADSLERDAADAMPGELMRMTGSPAIRYIPNQGIHGPAAARNAGWQAAQAPIIAFTDDDCLPEPGWLSAGVGAILAGADGASGKILMPTPVVPSDYERDASGLERSDFVTANCFYRRKVLEAMRGFDPRFKVAWREDTDLYFGTLEQGFQLVKVPEAVVIHPVRGARWGISLSQQKKSQFNALLFKKHPSLYRQRVQAGPPWHYYLTLIAMLAAAIGIAFHVTPLAGLGAGAWLGLTGNFISNRLKGTRHDRSHVAEMVITSILIPPVCVYWRLRGAITHRVWFF
jgi:glycosyltransferase involved in cell wall biosynthesis